MSLLADIMVLFWKPNHSNWHQWRTGAATTNGQRFPTQIISGRFNSLSNSVIRSDANFPNWICEWMGDRSRRSVGETSEQIVTNNDAGLYYYVYVRLPMPDDQTKESIIIIIIVIIRDEHGHCITDSKLLMCI